MELKQKLDEEFGYLQHYSLLTKNPKDNYKTSCFCWIFTKILLSYCPYSVAQNLSVSFDMCLFLLFTSIYIVIFLPLISSTLVLTFTYFFPYMYACMTYTSPFSGVSVSGSISSNGNPDTPTLLRRNSSIVQMSVRKLKSWLKWWMLFKLVHQRIIDWRTWC